MAEMPFAEKYYRSADGLSLYYRDYRPTGADRTPVLCLPGLTRNSKDFEDIAMRLRAGRRVLSPDLRGRGKSAYDPDFRHYLPGFYVGDILALLAAESLSKVVIIGTSLGGILAMLLASFNPGYLEAVVLNDVGPEIAPEGAARIAGYVGQMPKIESWDDAAEAQKKLNAAAFPGLYRRGLDGLRPAHLPGRRDGKAGGRLRRRNRPRLPRAATAGKRAARAGSLGRL